METWSAAIFSSREDVETLSLTVNSVISACKLKYTIIDIIVNGNINLSKDISRHITSLSREENGNIKFRIWHIPAPDKANAWNQYVYNIFLESSIAFFVDGYVQVKPDAFTSIADSLDKTPYALAATGVPTFGRSASALRERMMREGGLHGNLHAIRGTTLLRLRDYQFHLPLGIYWVDGLIGSVISFSLDPANNNWDPQRIFVCPDATWTIRPLSWWRINDLRRHWQRKYKQAQGRLENIAIREHMAVKKRKPEDLPRTNTELVMSWMKEFPWRAGRMFIKNPLCAFAIRRSCRSRDWSEAATRPELIMKIEVAKSERLGEGGGDKAALL